MRSFLEDWRRPSRGWLLASLAALLLLMPQAMTGYEVWRQYSVTMNVAERNINILVDLLAAEVLRSLSAVDQIIEQTTIDLSAFPDRSPQESRRLMRERALGIPSIFGLMVMDARGNVLASLHAFSPRHRSFAETVREQAQAEARPFHIGPVTPDPFDGTPVIPFARFRHGADGTIEGLTIASMSVQSFREMFLQVRALPHATLTLAQLDGRVLAQLPEGDGASLAHMPEFQPHAADSGLLMDAGHADRLVAYRTLRPFGLRLTVAVDAAELLAPWRSNMLRLILADVVISGLLAWGMLLVWRGWRAEAAQNLTRRQEELDQRMSRFALDNSADMVVWADEAGNIIYANRTAHQVLGYPDEVLVGMHVADIDPAFPAAVWPEKMADLRQATSLRFESRLRDRMGRDIPAEVSVSLFSWDGRDFTCAVIRDIVERKRAEAMLAERTRRLEASNAELEQFAYVASHDLREPLRMVSAFVGLLARRFGDQLDQEGQDYVKFAREGAERMDRLILDLLEYSRAGAPSRPLAVVDLTRAAEAARHDLSLAFVDCGARFEMPPHLPLVWGDESELTRLLVNLLGNALKYRHPDRQPVIRLAVEVQDGTATCRVEDNGIGIAPQYFDRIFRIFQRLHGRERYDGTGIGLAICKKIVEHHGGRIWVSSVPDQGSTFFFTLRLAVNAEA